MSITCKRKINFKLMLALLLTFLVLTPLLLFLRSNQSKFIGSEYYYNSGSRAKTLTFSTGATQEKSDSYPISNGSIVVIAGENRSVQMEITPDTLEAQTGAPGSSLNWLVEFKNTGNLPDNYTLYISEALSGVSTTTTQRSCWGATLDNTSFMLNPGTKAITYLRVIVPSDANTSERDNITVTISNGASVIENYEVSAYALEPGPRLRDGVIDLAIDTPVLAIDVWPTKYDFGVLVENKTATTGPNYFTVRNVGNVNETIIVRGTDAWSMPSEPSKWILTPSGTGVDQYMMKLDNLILTNSDQSIWGNVVPGAEEHFGLTVFNPTVVTTPARMWARIRLVSIAQIANNTISLASNGDTTHDTLDATIKDNVGTVKSYNRIAIPVTAANVGVPYGENVEGATVILPVTITSTGGAGDNFALSARDTNGWVLRLSTNIIYLDNGSSATVDLTVVLPPGTGGQTDTVTVIATSSASGTNFSSFNQVRSLRLLVDGEVTIMPDGNIAHCSVVKELVDPSYRYDPLTFAVAVQNKGPLDDMYELFPETDNTGLGLKLTPDELFIPAGDTEYAALSVSIPNNWWGGWSGIVTVVAKSKKFMFRHGNIEIRKVDESGNLLGGATFKVSPNPYGAGDLLVTDGGAQDSDPTSGIVLLENVSLGTYTITEDSAPAGYEADTTIKVVDVTSCMTVTMTFTNRHTNILGEIEILKVDEAGAVIEEPGSTFVISPNPYSVGDLTVVDGDANDQDPTLGVILLNNVPLGTYTVIENVAPLGYELNPTPQQAVVSTSAKVTLTFTNKLGKIEIRKVDEGNELLGGATFKVSPNPYGAGDLLVTDGGAQDSDPTSGIVLLENVPLGTYAITEHVAPSGYQDDNSVKVVDVTSSATVSVTFTDKKLELITRTQGFWSTHVMYTENVWSYVNNKMIGTKMIDDNGKLFGAFWSNMAKKSDGSKRTPLDQARMQLLQQLVAAILNVTAFGDDGTGTALIAAGKAAFVGNNANVVLNVANQLDTFNQSGDSSPFPPGVIPGPADPKEAKAITNIPFWDTLTMAVPGSGQYETNNINSFGTNRASTPAPLSGISTWIIIGIAILVGCVVIGAAILLVERK